MKRFAKILGWTLGVLIVLVGVAVAGGYYYLTSSDFRSIVERQASSFSGRKTKIEEVTIDWSMSPHVHVAGLKVANADWAKTDHMLKADEVDFTIRLWPLLKGDIVLPHLTLQQAGGHRREGRPARRAQLEHVGKPRR